MDLASNAFGSAFTFFVTTGSTIAIHAAIFAFTNHNDKIIVFDNMHKSVMNACIMYGLKMVITNEKQFAKTLTQNPDVALVLATSPTYYGKTYNIADISAITHKVGKILIVDEAHGTHFNFCKELFPKSALSQGADIVIQSAHKTTPALTQGSFLHISITVIDKYSQSGDKNEVINFVQSALSMVTTSSPSFIIASTLDYARMYLVKYGNEKYKSLFENIKFFYSILPDNWKTCFSKDYVDFLFLENYDKTDNLVDFDFSRIVLDLSNLKYKPSIISNLFSNNGIFIEFYDISNLVLICNIETTRDDFLYLADTIFSIENSSVYDENEKNHLEYSDDELYLLIET